MVPPKVLILNNGAYGVRQKEICEILNLNYEAIDYSDDVAVSAEDLDKRLSLPDGSTFTHVSFIHHETTVRTRTRQRQDKVVTSCNYISILFLP